jgi:hypothetical protein
MALLIFRELRHQSYEELSRVWLLAFSAFLIDWEGRDQGLDG